VFAPYPKWFGTAFQQLKCAAEISPHFRAALAATTWQERERCLVPAYEAVARMQNDLRVSDPIPDRVQPFFSRPFRVIALGGAAESITARIMDESVRALLKHPLVGSIDQFSDSTDLVENPEWRDALKSLYE
jgi:hypothetical protein